ncbi:MAG TPA: DUF4190 domain-containing protein [Candidatus Acidoferrum sp.]|nr:DUF4190 domain-containing protein [Candidatus Angelobacter sp.]HXD82644.1 DUF4190 domain-containing protein [Candidatus Acidoferrum sp.]
MSTTPGNLPPPPPQISGATQIAGQQSAPSTSVPPGPVGPMYTSAGAGTNTLAIVSLVAGIGSFFAHIIPGIGGFTVALIAIITGYMARHQIRQTGEKGMGMATAGMIIGAVHIALLVLLVIGLIFAIFVLGVVLFGVHR